MSHSGLRGANLSFDEREFPASFAVARPGCGVSGQPRRRSARPESCAVRARNGSSPESSTSPASRRTRTGGRTRPGSVPAMRCRWRPDLYLGRCARPPVEPARRTVQKCSDHASMKRAHLGHWPISCLRGECPRSFSARRRLSRLALHAPASGFVLGQRILIAYQEFVLIQLMSAGSGCLNSFPRMISGVPPGFVHSIAPGVGCDAGRAIARP
ncbi:hypothetical protein IQ26_04692 [Mesorhizobium tianshanense]|uniref:Uncharacterized protein n=1 Tax=Mesorhizobium tianshanense TaxID=39844 RepID=A0A562NF92_9HYPH|nr:hypothetical protein IQ26_04692 [Mesorhizobium tianshanense]